MSQQGQGSSSLPPKETPAKWKRGRPRKDANNQGRAEKKPASESEKNISKMKNTDDNSDDEMLGKVITGVIIGCFGDGYLVSFRIDDTDMTGALFQPGRYVPITLENDIAPNVPMYRRKLPIPSIQNPGSQGQVNNSTVPVAVSPGCPVMNENQTAAAVGELKNVEGDEQKKFEQKTDIDAEAGEKEPENHFPPGVDAVMPEPKVEDDQALSSELKPDETVLKEVKGLESDKRVNMEVDMTKQSRQTTAASLVITPCVENVNQGPQVENPKVSISDLKPNELICSAVTSLSIDFTQYSRGISQGSHDQVLSSDLKPTEPVHDGTNANVEATQESGIESAPLFDFMPCPVNVNSGPQIGQQALISDLKLDEVVQNEVKSTYVDEQGSDMVIEANLKPGPGSLPLLDYKLSIKNVRTQEPPIGDQVIQVPDTDLKPNEGKSPGVDDLGENIGIEANKEWGPGSAPCLWGATRIQGPSSDFKPIEEGKSQLLSALRNPSIESSQTPLLAQTALAAILSSEPMGNNIDTEMQSSPEKYPIQQDVTSKGSSSTPMTSLSPNMFDGGVIQSEPSGLGTEGSGATNSPESDFKDSATPNHP